LADLAFANKDYRQAYNFYDSLQLYDPELKDTATIRQRKEMLGQIALQTEIWARQDSLQRIALMPEDERKEFVKKILKQLLKAQGLKDDGSLSGGNPLAQPVDIFTSTQATKGEWYFYNTALRTKGASDFKAKWGNRPNVDNWRRIGAVANQSRNKLNRQDTGTAKKNMKSNEPEELSFESLYKQLPLTPEQLQLSNDSIQNAMFALGKIYAEQLEDCGLLISTFEDLRNKYPQFAKMDEVLFQLYYCYSKNGDATKAGQIKSLMSSKYPNSNFTVTLATGKNPNTSGKNSDATKTYEAIYDLFIEGKFDEALAQKKVADSLYGQNFWTPQLLYIESVYYIRERNDSTAIQTLQKIQTNYPNSPLAARAATMISVLGRRSQIEDELNKYQVVGQPEEKKQVDTVLTRPVPKTDTVAKKTNPPAIDNKKTNQPADTVAKKPVAPAPFTFDANAAHYAVIVLNKVDAVFGNEAKNAFFRYNREKYYNKTFEITTVNLDADNKLMLISPFTNAQEATDYVQKAKRIAPSEIIPWLKADKYSFSIISAQNLEILKSNPDLSVYKRFLDQNLPGKF
jgi:outer membrane protein assembly factor BamD (BamD/ComL family)